MNGTEAHEDVLQNRLTISVAEFCQVSGLGRTSAFSLILEGKLEVVRCKRRTLICVPSVRRLLTPEPTTAIDTPPDAGA